MKTAVLVLMSLVIGTSALAESRCDRAAIDRRLAEIQAALEEVSAVRSGVALRDPEEAKASYNELKLLREQQEALDARDACR